MPNQIVHLQGFGQIQYEGLPTDSAYRYVRNEPVIGASKTFANKNLVETSSMCHSWSSSVFPHFKVVDMCIINLFVFRVGWHHRLSKALPRLHGIQGQWTHAEVLSHSIGWASIKYTYHIYIYICIPKYIYIYIYVHHWLVLVLNLIKSCFSNLWPCFWFSVH